MKLPASSRPRAGFTLVEVVAVVAVLGAASGMLVAVMISARKTAALGAERQLAGALAQGALEGLRGAPPASLPGERPEARPLPAEGAALRDACLTATTSPWKGAPGVRQLTVTVTWDSRSGRRGRVVREALLSDARAR
jgi:prepilin-type N-terminal cleavage/methylation domain-containing protein